MRDIWLNGQAFQTYRGTSWMKEPCKSCPRAEIDFGGCRCQAMAFTGDAANTDPACKFSPFHAQFVAAAETESASANPPPFVYRRMGGARQDRQPSPTFATEPPSGCTAESMTEVMILPDVTKLFLRVRHLVQHGFTKRLPKSSR